MEFNKELRQKVAHGAQRLIDRLCLISETQFRHGLTWRIQDTKWMYVLYEMSGLDIKGCKNLVLSDLFFKCGHGQDSQRYPLNIWLIIDDR